MLDGAHGYEDRIKSVVGQLLAGWTLMLFSDREKRRETLRTGSQTINGKAEHTWKKQISNGKKKKKRNKKKILKETVEKFLKRTRACTCCLCACRCGAVAHSLLFVSGGRCALSHSVAQTSRAPAPHPVPESEWERSPGASSLSRPPLVSTYLWCQTVEPLTISVLL